MAQCKECIHGEVCDIFVHTRTLICNDNADKMCKLFKPTADVVPKSEVEWLEEMVVDKCNRCLKRWSEVVAKEIFEEIEKTFIDSAALPDCARFVDIDKIAELKKKYTEGESNNAE